MNNLSMKHLFLIIVTSMAVVITIQIINHQIEQDYQQDATMDRQSLKNLIVANDKRDTVLNNAIVEVLKRVYYLVNDTDTRNKQSDIILKQWNETFNTILDNQVKFGKDLNVSGIRIP